MSTATAQQLDTTRDLVLERVIDVPRELVWAAWTNPEHLKKWFTPAPWTTVDAELDVRPGGIFRTTMRSPEGQEFPDAGCFLEVIPNEKLVFTSALGPGFRPVIRLPKEGNCDDIYFTAVITLEALGPNQTRYRAVAMHGDEASTKKHESMGFHHGWSAALDQLVAFARTL